MLFARGAAAGLGKYISASSVAVRRSNTLAFSLRGPCPPEQRRVTMAVMVSHHGYLEQLFGTFNPMFGGMRCIGIRVPAWINGCLIVTF